MKMRKLTQNTKSESNKPNQDWIYGLHAVKYALQNPKRQIQMLLLTADSYEELSRDDIDLRAYKFELRSSFEIAKVLPQGAVHQGIAALSKPLHQLSLEEFLLENKDATSCCVIVLDQVTDPHNIGAIMRSAAAFGAQALIAPDRGTPLLTGTIAKSASGATEFVPFIRVSNLARGIEMLKKDGFWVIGLDEAGEKKLHEIDLTGKIALLMGAEGAGMRRLTLESCDFLAQLPTQKPIACLNVSNAAAISLYEYRKQNNH